MMVARYTRWDWHDIVAKVPFAALVLMLGEAETVEGPQPVDDSVLATITRRMRR